MARNSKKKSKKKSQILLAGEDTGSTGLYLLLLILVFFGSFAGVYFSGMFDSKTEEKVAQNQKVSVQNANRTDKRSDEETQKEESEKTMNTSSVNTVRVSLREEESEMDTEIVPETEEEMEPQPDRVQNLAADDPLNFGVLYSSAYYLEQNPDVAASIEGRSDVFAFEHFLKYGMAEGRDGSENFAVEFYKGENADLSSVYRSDLIDYYLDYLLFGKEEGREGNNGGNNPDYAVIAFSQIYNEKEYLEENPDIKMELENTLPELVRSDERLYSIEVLKSFLSKGMMEGRIGSKSFDPAYYRSSDEELAAALGEEWYAYYLHYALYGYAEGRIGAA